jgi:hypothetical protein
MPSNAVHGLRPVGLGPLSWALFLPNTLVRPLPLLFLDFIYDALRCLPFSVFRKAYGRGPSFQFFSPSVHFFFSVSLLVDNVVD